MLPYIIKVAWSKKLGATVLNWEKFDTLMRIEAPQKYYGMQRIPNILILKAFFFIKGIYKLVLHQMFSKEYLGINLNE